MRRFLLFLGILLPALFFVTDSLVPSCFRFDPAKLQEISKTAIAKHGENDVEALLRDMVGLLQAEYPGIIDDYDTSKWVFNVAGGATVRL